ncbi:MAG: hypothetical protein ACTSRZ_10210 [Promethearchaeota archaeon]
MIVYNKNINKRVKRLINIAHLIEFLLIIIFNILWLESISSSVITQILIFSLLVATYIFYLSFNFSLKFKKIKSTINLQSKNKEKISKLQQQSIKTNLNKNDQSYIELKRISSWKFWIKTIVTIIMFLIIGVFYFYILGFVVFILGG